MKGINHNWRKKEGLIKVLCKDCISNGGTRRYWDYKLNKTVKVCNAGARLNGAGGCMKFERKSR